MTKQWETLAGEALADAWQWKQRARIADDNARQLLRALEAAESFMSGFENDDMQEPPVTDRLTLIRAAIAAARGEA
jgi:hypothetical protein